ncbi:MAG: sulfatase-like hydrolase/transferase [Planctomycetes bacterium]|nr:sulfatase-like hydrolase/transferase [Planctomycetota bacterium]
MPAHNILVVVVDGLRASALGAYGNTSFPTPALDRFAADSFLLDWCYGQATELDAIYRDLWHSAARSLPQQLNSAGYTTTLVTDVPELAAFDAANAFDRCLQIADKPSRRAGNARTADASHTSLARLFATASEVVASAKPGTSQLFWLHARGMYGPWDAPLELQQSLLDESDPPPVDEATPPDFVVTDADDPDAAFRYACAYAAQAMVLDECWDALLNTLESNDSANQWLVTLLGARGYPLGEHRRVGGVDPRLYSEQLHVPWLIRFPGQLGRLGRSNQLTTHVDLASVLLDLNDGANIRSLAMSARPRWRDALISTSLLGQRAIRTCEWCLRQDSSTAPSSELFVRPDDRWEANDVAKLCPDVVETLTKTMDETLHP